MNTQVQNQRTVFRLLGIVAVMGTLAAFSPILYDTFCRVTGFSGTTQISDQAPDVILDQKVLVRFSANIDANMPWEFKPKQPNVEVRIGETNLVFFEAYNPTDKVITGTASFNVAPFELGGYFDKIECFCFTEQTLQPGERVEMPVSFYLDPAMVEDADTKDIESMTLAYTFHLTDEQTVAASDNSQPKPSLY